MWRLAVPSVLVVLALPGCTISINMEAGQQETDTLDRSMKTVAVIRAHLTNVDAAVHANHLVKADRGLAEAKARLDNNLEFKDEADGPSEEFSVQMLEIDQELADSYGRERNSSPADRADAIAREHVLRIPLEDEFNQALEDADFDSYGLGTTSEDDVRQMITQYTKNFRERYEPGQSWPVPRWRKAQIKADARAKERSRSQKP